MKQLLFGGAAVVAFYSYILPAVTLLNFAKRRQPLTDTTRFLMQPLFPAVDLGGPRVIANATLPWPNPRRAITLGRSIYVRNAFDQLVTRDLRLLLHELVHVDQYRRMGTLGFIWAYGRALARDGSYRKNALEVEAFAFAMLHRGSVGGG
jgi:hypothetical protein